MTIVTFFGGAIKVLCLPLSPLDHPCYNKGMNRPTYTVPYDRGELAFELPPGVSGTVILPRPMPPLPDVGAAVRAALAAPVAGPRLRDLPGVQPGATVCIVVTDVTRASPDALIVPALLDELAAGGVRDADITILVGVGLHRPSTPEEHVEELGQAVLDRVRVLDHRAQDPGELTDLGQAGTLLPIPAVLNRRAVAADVLIATGIVEPHQFAGYSGGRKTVAIGVAGEATIAATHGPRFLDHPGTRLARIDGNPFHEAVTEIAARAGLRFIVNVVCDGDHRPVAVRAGAPTPTFEALVALAAQLYTVPVPHAYDVAIGGVGWPKDTNLYQASRAASYLAFAPTPVVRPGGAFIIPARCGEGAGAGTGEQRFFRAMADAPSVGWILEDARANGYPPGGQRAFVMAKVLEQHPVIIVGADDPAMIAAAKFTPAATLAEAFALVAQAGPLQDALIVPHALLTLPDVKREM